MVEKLEPEALSRCPSIAIRFVGWNQHNRSTRLARIATPKNTEPIPFRAHFSALNTVRIS
ncbi:hypothetical protein G6321_00039210 [Bradyrhizobium barranii subsp. barranii]|uniref:Uncharacterized protein n=1 Tax=Bradyrhizobium barranii subsp. barranii TaxID=2823807 RepID=A0A7Z0TNG7_9BRAD|nr:hypothetical protein [Bradyrhizobium barranii]UGX91731.1 hypothetical protein G6321_00039210 [Bradyrhizobium barranii subsp. barranii]